MKSCSLLAEAVRGNDQELERVEWVAKSVEEVLFRILRELPLGVLVVLAA